MLGMQRQYPFLAVSNVLLMTLSAVSSSEEVSRLPWSELTTAVTEGGLLRSSKAL